jgi:hypothetical protein
MEYAPVNLGRPGEPAPAPFQSTLGPYDYWAIEYAYKPFAPGSTPAEQEAELQRIAARSPDPLLAYGTDEDNLLGLDPESLVFDLGRRPAGVRQESASRSRTTFSQRQETRALKSTEDYAVLRRALGYALRDATRAAGVLARQIGGLRTLRDYPGSGRDPLVPVPAAVQREALDTLSQNFLAAGSFRISPSLARKLAPDYLERFGGTEPVPTDFSLDEIMLDLQRALLNQLMSETLAARLLDAQSKAASPREAFGAVRAARSLDARDLVRAGPRRHPGRAQGPAARAPLATGESADQAVGQQPRGCACAGARRGTQPAR